MTETALIRLICPRRHRWWGHAVGNLKIGDPCPECSETMIEEKRGPMTYVERATND